MLIQNSNISPPPYLSSLFENFLGESPRVAKLLSQEWAKYRQHSKKNWSTGTEQASSKSIRRANLFVLSNESAVRAFLNSTYSGIVFMTIHMGDYLHGSLKLLSLIRGRNVLILRRHKPTQEELHMFRKIEEFGHTLEVVYHNNSSIRRIVKALRQGAIAVVLHDLSKEWGRVIQVNAFGRRLNWASGPVELSILSRSCVLPFHCFTERKTHFCQFDAVRDYRQLQRDNDTLLLKREVQHFVSITEKYIKEYATQWHHWPLIPEMLAE